MMSLLLLIYGLIGNALLGIAAVAGLQRILRAGSSSEGNGLGRVELLGLGLAVGIALNSWLLFLSSLIRIPLGRGLSLTLACAGWIAFGVPWWQGGNPRFFREERSSLLIRFCKWGIAFILLNLLIQTLLTPQRLWDERAIFGIKAIVLDQEHSIHSPVLGSADFVQYHPRYPLLIPLAEQNVYAFLGQVDDRLSKLIFPLMALGVILSYAGVLSRHLGPDRGWLFALMLATVPSLIFWDYGFLCGQGDAPTACYHGLAVLYLWDWLKGLSHAKKDSPSGMWEKSFSLILGAFFTGMTIFVKDEGIAFFLVDSIALGGLLLIGREPAWRHRLLSGLMFFGTVLIIVVPWFWHRQGLPKTGEMTYFDRMSVESVQTGMFRLNWSLSHLWSRMFREAGTWGLPWWGVLLGVLIRPRNILSRAQAFLLLDMAGAIAALVLASLIAPTTVEEHLGGSSHRFLMQLVPVAVLFLAGQLKEPAMQKIARPQQIPVIETAKAR